MMKHLRWGLVLALAILIMGLLCGMASAVDYCGENVTWSLNKSGVLTISGTGAMSDYVSENALPWYNRKENIKKIVIHEGVTHIGDYAFYYCNSLSSVTIADSVTSIGNYAFCGCDVLTTLLLPPNIQSIGTSAFDTCLNLTGMTIPEGITRIESRTFQACRSLENVTIPSSVTFIGDEAFDDCGMLSKVTYNGSSTEWGNISFGSNNTGLKEATVTFLKADDGTCGTDVRWHLGDDGMLTISGTGTMSNYTASNTAPWQSEAASIVSVFIEDQVTNIGDWAFYGCQGLRGLEIPDTISDINSCAFKDCISLTGVIILGDTTRIADDAFDNVSGFTIYGRENSNAQTFAIDKGIPFIAIEGNHYLIKHDRVEATATTDGTEEYWECAVCHALFGDSTGQTSLNEPVSIPATGEQPQEKALATPGSVWTYYTGLSKTRPETGGVYGTTELGLFMIPRDDRVAGAAEPEWSMEWIDGPDCFELFDAEYKHFPADQGYIREFREKDGIVFTDGRSTYKISCFYNGEVYSAVFYVDIVTLPILPTGITLEVAEFDANTQTIGSYTPIQDGTVSLEEGKTTTVRGTFAGYWPGNENDYRMYFSGQGGFSEDPNKSGYIDSQGNRLFGDNIILAQGTTSGTYTNSATLELVMSNMIAFTPFELVVTTTETTKRSLEQFSSEATWYMGLPYAGADNDGLCSFTFMEDFWIPESERDETNRSVEWTLICTSGVDNFQLDYNPDDGRMGGEFTAALKPRDGELTPGDSTYLMRAVYMGVTYEGTVTAHTVNTGLPTGMTIRIFETDTAGATIGKEIPVINGCAVLKKGKNYYLTGCFDGVNLDIYDQWMNYYPELNGIDFGSRWQGEAYSVSQDYSFCWSNSLMFTAKEAGTYSFTAMLSLGSGSNLGAYLPINFTLFDLDTMSVFYLPDELTIIGEEAFSGLACEAVVVPGGCESIGHYAFRNCKNLQYILVPVGTEVSGDAFEGCGDVYIERATTE